MVTGGAGFIGSNLVDRLLAEGHEVDVVDDLSAGTLANLAAARSDPANELRFYNLDIRSDGMVELITRRRPNVIFHLAAQADVRVSVARSLFDADVNILGSLRVLEGARAVDGARFVFAASGGTLYGEPDPGMLPIGESSPHRPLSPYAVSKKAVIDYLYAYRELHDVEFCALALANVYGPRQNVHGEAGVVAIFARRLLAGDACTIYGDGSQTRDFVHVDDVVDAFVRAAERGGGLVMNIGTGKETSVNELYATMERLAGVDMPANHKPSRPGELHRNCLDPSRAGIHLGWKPWTQLDDGITSVLEYLRPAPGGPEPGHARAAGAAGAGGAGS